jgi:hypothetical protein
MGGGLSMKIATIGQHENGTFYGEIRDEFGDIEAATTKMTAQEVHIWASEHGADELKLEEV